MHLKKLDVETDIKEQPHSAILRQLTTLKPRPRFIEHEFKKRYLYQVCKEHSTSQYNKNTIDGTIFENH